MTLVRSSSTGIIGLQRRLVEVGRIRSGEKVASSNGTRPAKRETWRLTSRDKQRLDAAAAIYGGKVTPWKDHDGQFELNTDSDALDVAVVPGQAISQSFEQWGQEHPKSHKGPNPVICLRRCDGTTELYSSSDCLCAQEEEPVCKPTTRLSVVLTRVPGLGVWRVESHGWNAAAELAGGVQLLEALVASNRPVRARLRLDQRRQTTRRGERHFVVPVLDIDHTLDEVLAITSAPSAAPTVAELETGPSFTPVPELEEGPGASIAEQVGAVNEPQPRLQRSNAAEPLKPTGRRPRRAEEVPGSVSESANPAPGDDEDSGSRNYGPSGQSSSSSPPTDEQGGMPRFQVVAMWCSDAGLDDEARHRFLEAFSNVMVNSAGGEKYSSSKDVPHEHMPWLRRALDRLKAGGMTLDPEKPVLYGRDGTVVEKVGGKDPVPPAGATEGTWDRARWRDALKNVAGVGEVKLLKQARTIAGELSIDLPRDLDGITNEQLVIRCLTWLREQQQ